MCVNFLRFPVIGGLTLWSSESLILRVSVESWSERFRSWMNIQGKTIFMVVELEGPQYILIPQLSTKTFSSRFVFAISCPFLGLNSPWQIEVYHRNISKPFFLGAILGVYMGKSKFMYNFKGMDSHELSSSEAPRFHPGTSGQGKILQLFAR